MDTVNALRDELSVSSALRGVINEDAALPAVEEEAGIPAVGDALTSSSPRAGRVSRADRSRAKAYRRPPVWDLSRGKHIDIYA